MPLSHPLTADLGEMGGVVTAGACIAAGLVLTAPTAAARRRARRRATAAFRLRRRRNFWRYLLGWGELPPLRFPNPTDVLIRLHEDRVLRLVFPDYAQEGSR